MNTFRLLRLLVMLLLFNALMGLFGLELPVEASHTKLSVTLTDSIDPVLLGQTLIWDATITNEHAVDMALSVVAHTMVPYGAHLQTIETSQGRCHQRHRYINCYLGNLHPHQTVHMQMTVTIDEHALYHLPPDQLLRYAVTITSFSNRTPGAAAAGDTEQTLVLEALPEEPVEEPEVIEEEPEVVPKTIAVSPSCVEPGASLTLFGEGFDILGLEQNDVKVGGVIAPILAFSGTGIVVEVPDLPEGSVTVSVIDVINTPSVRISTQCNPRLFTPQDVEIGFVSGDILIFFKEDLSPEELEAFRLEYNFKELIQHPLLGYYFAQLNDEDKNQSQAQFPVIDEPDAPVDCLINLRSAAQPVDLLLLVDRSGTMESSVLKPYLRELLNQMYCLVNRESRISLMVFNEETELVAPFEPWSAQSDVLRAWSNQPLQPRRQSKLESALNNALDYVTAQRRDVNPQIMVLTRGPANPPITAPEVLIEKAVSQDITIHGLGFTSRFFDDNSYDELADITEATGRDLLLFDERDISQLAQVATCSIVYGIFGQNCQQQTQVEETEQSPATDSVTCSIVSGIYGVSTCGEGSLDLIPTLLADRTTQVINALNNDPRVDEAFFNDLLDESQNDPELLDQNWFVSLGLPEGWDMFFPKLGEGTSIGIIDTGVDLSLIASNVLELSLSQEAPEGLNFAPVPPEEDQTANDQLGHGTAVSTIAASVSNNAFNGAGVSPKATLIPFKVFAVVDGQVKASNDSVAQALMNAFVLGVDVVNMSLGCSGCNEEQENTLRRFYGRIIDNLFGQFEDQSPIIVAASGNDGDNYLDSPASHERVISVGSVRANLTQRSRFSNYGPELDFVALGENTFTTLMGSAFGSSGSGTSFSAPQVAGLVSLILAETPGLSLDEMMDKIKQCFIIDLGPAGFDEETGWGRIHIPADASQVPPECLNE